MASTVPVGVAGSDQAQAAPTRAARHTRDRDDDLRVVTVCGPREEEDPHAAQLANQAPCPVLGIRGDDPD